MTQKTTDILGDAEAVAAWCVFWSEMPGGPAQGAVAAKVIRTQAKVIRAQAAEIVRLRRGWLRVIQQENNCPATGGGCLAKRCGCQAEQDLLMDDHDNAK